MLPRFPACLGPIWTQCRKELLQLLRLRMTLVLAFGLPVIYLLIYGFAMRLEVKELRLGIQDYDHTPLSRAYIETLAATSRFRLLTVKPSEGDGSRLIDNNQAQAVLIIPPGFGRKIKGHQISRIQALINGIDVNNARIAAATIDFSTRSFLTSHGLDHPTNKFLLQPEIRLWYNPGSKEELFLVPGSFAVILWVYPSLLSALAMSREHEMGTLIHVYSSGLAANLFLLGKGLAYLLVGIGETLLVMVLGVSIFGLNMVGSPFFFCLGTLLYLINSVMFGLFFGVRSESQGEATQKVLGVGYLTSLLLSGYLFPLSNLPLPLALLSTIVPARYYVDLSRDFYLKGVGWINIWYVPFILSITAVALFLGTRQKLSRMQLP
jgi:ABC-2 type transport system permease protein